jgi:hypothetical protein
VTFIRLPFNGEGKLATLPSNSPRTHPVGRFVVAVTTVVTDTFLLMINGVASAAQLPVGQTSADSALFGYATNR